MRRSFRRAVALMMPVVMASSFVGLAGSAAAAPGSPAGDGKVAAALAKARESGRPVEVVSRRSETAQVFAQPDGTQRMVVSARPVRVKKGKTWVDVDAALTVRADGSLGPKASTVDVAFSRGGDEPLIRIAKDGARLAYTWPARLPAPKVEGSVATYREVFPSVV